ncbi:c-type cytochrome [Limimaricola pyoseonensis]|uniref:Cytochrome c n=1 Tax=Limimaricola pyoseonensis TaxID=521013 RepID=A0A1G7L483_9RHOB|nr:c-type cytochrome [Limimaricola pyoseonensis]SDF44166.1 cytochrome c [Limimaricola pyoseonensis]
MRTLAFSALTALLAGPTLAQEMTGDAANGETEFSRQCVSCHVVADESGEVLAGRNGRVGPNLYGVAGRQPGIVEDFRYSDALVAYGELAPDADATGTAPTGEGIETVIWAQANTVAYLQDPTGFLREALDDSRARGKMAYKVRDPQTAADLYAYLATFSPDLEMTGEADMSEGESAQN